MTDSYIEYSPIRSFWGSGWAAISPKGIHAISLAPSPSFFFKSIRRYCHRHHCSMRQTSTGAIWINEITTALNEGGLTTPAPLDVEGTAFQKAVWSALLDIPPGETRSYQSLARIIGQPNAVRAVANACGANPIIIFIPCHRVIRANGALGGYHAGIDLKRRLLSHELMHYRPLP